MHSLPSQFSLAPFCSVFTWKPLALMSIFSLVFHHSTLKPEVRCNVGLNGHVNDVVQAFTTDKVQGWIREVNCNFGEASCEEQLGESYT